MKKIVVDSGPLIALFNASDKYNLQAINFVKNNKYPLYTTLPSVTEVMYLLDFNINAQVDFLEWITRGGITIINIDENEMHPISTLMKKYKDLPMDFTDATIVLSCEKLNTKHIATIDRNFEIYRFRNKQKFVNNFYN